MNNNIIYTIGTGTRTIEQFTSIIKQRKISMLVDVRRFPTSRFEHFKKGNFSQICKGYGLEYIYLGNELGGYRKEGYETYTKSKQFVSGINKIKSFAKEKIICIVCAETLPWKCHRRFIGTTLSTQGYEVIHVIDEKHNWRPRA